MVIHHVRANKLDILEIPLDLELKTSWIFFKTWPNFITSNPTGKIKCEIHKDETYPQQRQIMPDLEEILGD